MRTITLEELLEAGCHFGHQVTRQNPKARDFVFEARDNIHIIDLAKTKEGLEDAAEFIHDIAKKNGTLVVLGAKRQAEGIVKAEVKRAQTEGADGIFFVTNRWIGGTLTNFSEVTKNFKRLKDLVQKLHSDEEKAKYTKKEVSLWEKERVKLENFYGGIADMQKIPDAVFIIDTHLEDLAVRETLRMHVKTVGITDTNSDPNMIDYPIPANDDAIGSIQLITQYIVDAWIEGRKAGKSEQQKTEEKKNKDANREKKETGEAQEVHVKEEVREGHVVKTTQTIDAKEKKSPTKTTAKTKKTTTKTE